MLKIMTFNIRYGLAEDGDNRWERRKSLVSARIHAFDPDLIGLQECRDDGQAQFIKDSLPDYQFYGVRREGGGATDLEMAPILFRKSAFQVSRTGRFWLSETPRIPGSKSWDSVFARTATWVKLIHRRSGRMMAFLNTHFDYQPAAIEGSARLLKRWAAQTARQCPLIVTGDFNADKNSSAYQHLAGGGVLFDVFRQANPEGGNEATFHGFGHPDEEMAIDWILASSHFEGVTAEVDRTHEGGLYPSDHWPVTALLRWK